VSRLPKVYISSTYKDLIRHRKVVNDRLRQMRYDTIAMEDYVACEDRPVDKCLADVASCDLYVGIFAWRYGYIPPGYSQSITELEYRKAGERRIKRLIFVLAGDAPWNPAMMDATTGDSEAGKRIAALRGELQREHTVMFFKSEEELGGHAATAVSKWLMENHDRFEDKIDAPAVSLWIRGWGPLPACADTPTVDRDWTRHFDKYKRLVPDQNIWDNTLLPSLVKAQTAFRKVPGGSFVRFRGTLPLSTAIAVGAAFPEVAGWRLEIEQPTRSQPQWWRSDAKPSGLGFRVVDATGAAGQDLLLAFGIAGSVCRDARAYADKTGLFSAFVCVEPENGPGDASVGTAGDAVSLAVQAKELIRAYRAKYDSRRTHIIIFGPQAFCILLGQKLNAVGDIVLHERTADGSYRQALVLRTG